MAWEICEDCDEMKRRATESGQQHKYCLERGKYCVGPEPDDLDCNNDDGLVNKVINSIKNIVV